MACVALSSLMRTIELDLLNPGRSAIVEDEEQRTSHASSSEVNEPNDDLRWGLLLRVLEFSRPITSGSSLNCISLLRYLGICLGDSSLPLGYLLHLLSRSQNLQTLIVSHKPNSINDGLSSCHYLSSEMWASQELSHVECSYLISLDPPNELETLKIRAINQNICLGNPQAFPQNLKELTLYHTRLQWKHINIIGNIPSLQVLKLKREAVCGETWEPSHEGFCQLKFLLIDYCDQFQYWEATTPYHYPVLERLVIRNCRLLKEFPDSFEGMINLRLIEISNCSPDLLNSAYRIQEAQKELGNDEFVVRDATPLSRLVAIVGFAALCQIM
nr:putative late blight resistance protein homolog R1B-16 [Ipomoea batatas]